MTILPRRDVPQHILKESVLAHIAAAYFSVGKQLEKKTNCSATRGFILATLRDAATLNQNQIATQLNFDRTVVHRAIKTMVREGLLAEKKAPSGRAILLSLTTKGTAYRKRLIQARVSADEKVRQALSENDRATLMRLLQQIAGLTL
jgi:DNA-binding MarR family transcriptional regulator